MQVLSRKFLPCLQRTWQRGRSTYIYYGMDAGEDDPQAPSRVVSDDGFSFGQDAYHRVMAKRYVPLSVYRRRVRAKENILKAHQIVDRALFSYVEDRMASSSTRK